MFRLVYYYIEIYIKQVHLAGIPSMYADILAEFEMWVNSRGRIWL